MSRQSSFAQQITNAVNRKLAETRIIQTQMSLDAAMMAANDVFNMGESRCAAFAQAYSEYMMEIANMTCEDTPDIEYTKTKIDERLKQICGKHFQPWEERYKG